MENETDPLSFFKPSAILSSSASCVYAVGSVGATESPFSIVVLNVIPPWMLPVELSLKATV